MILTNYLMQDGERFYVKQCNGYKPDGYVAVLPSSIEKADFPFVKARTVHNEELGIDVLEVYVDDIMKGEAIIDAQTEQSKIDFRKSYLADIDAEMKRIFGTTNRDKANSLYMTWKLWKEDPSFFSDKGLLDGNGDPLDTASKISIYAQQKIDESKDYSVFLITREKQYKDALAAL